MDRIKEAGKSGGSRKLMGILNLTPDSFYDGHRYLKEEQYLAQVEKMLSEGADIIDIGAVSSRPGATMPDEKEEITRLSKAVKTIIKHFPDIRLSLDTFRKPVAEIFWNEGISIINDISGGTFDHEMIPFVDKNHIPYVLMHIQGKPQTMQQNPHYENVVTEVKAFFAKQLSKFRNPENVILDPGFGFGKTLSHNYQLLKHLPEFQSSGLPVLVGISRKSMIYKLLNTNPQEALNGSSIVHTIALLNGANILRVHDVKEAKEVIKIVNYLELTT